MSIFDRFTAKPQIPKGYAEVKVEFTEEEVDVIERKLEMYADIAKFKRPDADLYVSPKFKNAMTAQALNEHVETLALEMENCKSREKLAMLADKAIKTQLKAYVIHSLPVYLFKVGAMADFAGDTAKAEEFFTLFLDAQSKFKSDQVDTTFLDQIGVDIPTVVGLAKQKLGIKSS